MKTEDVKDNRSEETDSANEIGSVLRKSPGKMGVWNRIKKNISLFSVEGEGGNEEDQYYKTKIHIEEMRMGQHFCLWMLIVFFSVLIVKIGLENYTDYTWAKSYFFSLDKYEVSCLYELQEKTIGGENLIFI